MKRIILFAIIALLSIGTQAQSETGIKFEHGTWAEVLQKAKTEKKNIFIDCYAVWCGPCKMLSNNVFPQKEVGEYFNTNFINFKVDMEKGEGIELQKKFNVGSFPTMLFVNDKGEIIHRVLGFVEAHELIEEAQKAPSMGRQILKIEKKYAKKNDDPQVVKEFLFYLLEGGDTRVEEVANHYFSLLSEEQYAEEGNFWIIKNVVKDPFAPVLDYINDNKEKFTATYGEDAVDLVINGKYARKASLLAYEANEGKPFNEEEFQRLIALMEERAYDSADDIIFRTRLKVLTYQEKWDEYMEMMEKKYDEIGRDSLVFKRDIYAYLGDIAYGCDDKEILERVYAYYDNAVNSLQGFVMHEYVSIWIVKEVIMKKMDRPEELEVIQIQLSLLRMLNTKYNEAYKS